MNRRELLAGAAGTGVGLMGVLASETAAAKRRIGPWQVADLRATPEAEISRDVQIVPGEPAVHLRTVYYAGLRYRDRPTRVFGYLATPAVMAERPLPAMALVHGGGGTAFPEWATLWAKRGYVALAMDLAGRGPDRQPLPDGGPDQTDKEKFHSLDLGLENMWTTHAVANVTRAGSLLRSLPYVDRRRLGMTGISWGGYLTSIVAGVEPRFKVAVPVYGCGFLDENSVWTPLLKKMPPADRALWVENFDPKQYLPRARMPMLWVSGTNDFAYPLDSLQKSYRAPRGERTLCVTVRMPHGHQAGWARAEIGAFVDSHLLNGPALPRVKHSREREGLVSVRFSGAVEDATAHLHWTADTVTWNEREWQTLPAQVDDGRASARLPAKRPLAYFFTVTDSRGHTVSSEHAVVK